MSRITMRPQVDPDETRRMESLRTCGQEFQAQYRRNREGLRALCQPVRVWSVDPATRQVIVGTQRKTYLVALSPRAAIFLQSHPAKKAYFVAELLDQAGAPQARFLVRIEDSEPGRRGIYAVRGVILDTVAQHPVGVAFDASHFGHP